MPTLDDLLSQTMLFAGTRWKNQHPNPIPEGKSLTMQPKPRPQTMEEVGGREAVQKATLLSNAIWSFGWESSHPAKVNDVKIRTRGMGMDYGMDADVFEHVEFLDCKIKRESGEEHELPLDAAHMVGAWWSRVGQIPVGGLGLWKLEARLDSSVLVAFAFQLADDGIKPLSRQEVDDLGEDLIPGLFAKPSLGFFAGDEGQPFVCVGPCRYVVAIELVLCKERPDFVPGTLVSFARIHPHAFVWSNEPLLNTQVSIVLQRPAKGMQCDPNMTAEIGALLVSDTNDDHGGSSEFDFPLPYTDNLYDYYAVDPVKAIGSRDPTKLAHEHPEQNTGEVTLADSRYKGERFVEKAVTRHTPLLLRKHRDIRKCRRQGQFDNIHLAARMKAPIEGVDDPTLLSIVMINQCVHDCVHMHVRWAEFLDAENWFVDTKMMHGWGENGPLSAPGLPAVPPNQTVFASFPNTHGLKYRAVAEGVKPGHMQVFCHHGAAYAVDEWPTIWAKTKIMGLWTFIHTQANLFDEPHAVKIPFGWLEFYWRVRYTAPPGWIGEPMERLQFELAKCIACEEP